MSWLLPPLPPPSSLLLPRPPCLLYTPWEMYLCVVCDSAENFIRKYWLWHVVCCRTSRRGDRTNERTNECTRRWETQKNTECPSLFFLLFYFNISFLFHSFVCIAPDQTTQTKSTERVCARYMLRVFYAQAAIFTPFFLSGSIFTYDSEQQLFNGNWTNEWWTSHRSVWMHYHMCVHTFVCCCAVCIGQ